ncbi:AmmeMemoRadiSam system radical SAM enzyme [Nanoarchaeota archaeon]
MKEAKYWKKLKDTTVQCMLCPRACVIKDGDRGDCRVRENQKGTLFSMVYGKPCAMVLDPVEKKPQYHFLPGSFSFSIGTAGCNLHCKFCQNWEMSQSTEEELQNYSLSPEQVVQEALKTDAKSIAYTYNDPIVFFEYAQDCAKIAKKKGLKNIFVTNLFINEEPLREICKVMDAFHVDLKGFNDKFYREVTLAWLEPILNNLKILKEEGVWFEIINLVIPGHNDNEEDIKEMCKWIKDNLGVDVPLHFSRFFPYYEMMDVDSTPLKTLEKFYNIAKKAGLKYVYLGNVREREDNTLCPKCSKTLIKRTSFFEVTKNNIEKGKCKFCKEPIAGVFK